MSSKATRNNLRMILDGFHTAKEPKRSVLATNTLIAVGILDWISAQYFSFTVQDLAAELELADTSVRRHLKTLVVCGWINQCESRGNGSNAEKTYRSNVRIRRINASASTADIRR
jgi:response regulator of citrate/malate metabolism